MGVELAVLSGWEGRYCISHLSIAVTLVNQEPFMSSCRWRFPPDMLRFPVWVRKMELADFEEDIKLTVWFVGNGQDQIRKEKSEKCKKHTFK